MTLPVMIFAAGFGTRMRPLTDDRPKPLIDIGGKPLLDHALAIAQTANTDPIIVNAHYKADMIQNHLENSGIQVIVEAPNILETGGGLRAARPSLGADIVATLNSDAIWENDTGLTQLISAWDPSRMDALLLCVPKAKAMGYQGPGDFDLRDGKLNFREDQHADYVYTGLQIINAARLSEIKEEVFSIKKLWQVFETEGRLFGSIYDHAWCDVGHVDTIPLGEALNAKRSNG